MPDNPPVKVEVKPFKNLSLEEIQAVLEKKKATPPDPPKPAPKPKGRK